MLILVVGPSGAGKDTLLDAARVRLAGDRRFRFVRRHITRPREAGGEDHIAETEASFAEQRFALNWAAHGLHYGIPADIAADLARGVVVVANVSRAVIAEAARHFAVRVLQITAPNEVLAHRLAARGREDAGDIARRLQRSVALPGGVEVVTVINDASVEAGTVLALDALSRAAESARPG